MKPPKQKLPKIQKAPKVNKQKLPKEEKQKLPKAPGRPGAAKTVIIIILAVALIAESAALVMAKLKAPSGDVVRNSDGQLQFALNIDMSGIGNTAINSVSAAAVSAIDDIKAGYMPNLDIMGTVNSLIYSDAIVNTVMSMSYPLLKTVLTDLGMMDFAENVSLYPTPERLAPLFEGSVYSCLNVSGERKPLKEVLEEAGDDWGYMDRKIDVADNKGNVKQDTLWNTIVWGVTDKESFFKAMNDMSEGIRGVLEICMQGKERIVNINVVDYLLKFDKINVDLDAARVFNASAASGYELCMIPLFNILGLREGEYRSVETFCAYTSLGDIWKAILEPVLFAVEKAMQSPMQGLCDMLVNFADAVDSGTLTTGMSSLRMDAEYHQLAKSFMGFKDGLLFNLGDALIDIVGSLGLDLRGGFNGLLDGLLQTILKNPAADMPDMDVAALKACAVQTTLPNGNKVWSTNYDQVVNYLIGYAVQGRTVELVLSQTPLAGTPEAAKIVSAIDKSKDGLTEIVNVVLSLVLEKVG